MSKVDPFTRESHELLGTHDDDPTAEEVGMQELQCREEGHYVRVWATDLEDDATAARHGATFFARCTCGDYHPDCAPDELATTTVDELRLWARHHRESHGLAWQQWLGHVPALVVWSIRWQQQGHLVGAGPVSEDEHADGTSGWSAICSCVHEEDRPDLDDPALEEYIKARTFSGETRDDVELWAAEHRARHGLEPQAFLPPQGLATFGVSAFV